jgi:2-hydroxychromene-2-carboxylate isomerase
MATPHGIGSKPRLVVYGDFNCPYSCLASTRVDALMRTGVVDIEWRAVEHDQTIPRPSQPVDGELAEMFDREIAEVTGLVQPGEAFQIRRPVVQPNSAVATATFASVEPDEREGVRQRLFAALWAESLDIGRPDLVASLAVKPTTAGRRLVDEWRSAWLGLDRRLVPMLVLPDGTVSRGLGALARLATYEPSP